MYIPPFEKLEKADKDGAMALINRTRCVLAKLRNRLEHPYYRCSEIVCPSELTVYQCERDFLDMAIERFISLGGEYQPTKLERACKEFDEKLDKISKVTLIKGKYLFGDFNNQRVAAICGEEVFIASRDGYSGQERDTIIDKPTFLEELKSMRIGEWRHDYRPERFGISMLDGESWRLIIEYVGGGKKEYGGCNAYPYNFSDLTWLFDEHFV